MYWLATLSDKKAIKQTEVPNVAQIEKNVCLAEGIFVYQCNFLLQFADSFGCSFSIRSIDLFIYSSIYLGVAHLIYTEEVHEIIFEKKKIVDKYFEKKNALD